MKHTDNAIVAFYGAFIAAVTWPFRFARNLRLYFTSDAKLIQAALKCYRRLSARDFDLSGYEVQIVRHVWRIEVHFRQSVKYVPPHTSYIDDVIVYLSSDKARTDHVSNPPDADHDNVISYRETDKHKRVIAHVLKALHASYPDRFPAGRKPFSDDAKLTIRDCGDAYEAELVTPHDEITHTIQKSGPAVATVTAPDED